MSPKKEQWPDSRLVISNEPLNSRKVHSVRCLLVVMVGWTILVTISLTVIFDKISLPVNLHNPYVLIFSFIFLWLTGLFGIRGIWQGLCADLRHRKVVENELRHSESQTRSILEAVGQGLCGLDRRGNIVFINSMAARMLGYTVEEIVGQNAHRLFHYKHLNGRQHLADKCHILAAIRDNEVTKTQDDVFWHKDGSSFPVEYTTTPICTNGEVSGCVMVFDDITERQQIEAARLSSTGRREQVKRLKSLTVLASGIAHNFNNILTAVMGNIELLLYRLSDSNHKERQFANAAMKAARRAAGLSTLMLWYVGQGKIGQQIIDMQDILQEVIEQIGSEDLCGCTLKDMNTGPKPMKFKGDEALVRQIIINLIRNAAEAMANQPGEIKMEIGHREVLEGELGVPYMDGTLEAGAYIYLKISDQGVGMSENAMEHIFEPFYTTKFIGRGLGLPSTLGVMRSHKGGVDISSELGSGTTAVILFPAAASLEDDQPVFDDHLENFQGVTILFIEDEEVLRECNGDILQLLGFEVLMAKDGFAALDVYQKHQKKIALVLLDIGLPKMDGAEALARLRKINSDVKVVIQTGYQPEEIADKFSPGNIAGYIQKPFVLQDLRQVLSKVLGN